MKNLFLFSFLFFVGLASCSKESIDPSTPFESLVKQAEVTINVTHQNWTDSLSNVSCNGDGLSPVHVVEDAVVTIYQGDPTDGNDSGFNRLTGLTGRSGSVTFSGLEPGEYTIIANSIFGEQTKIVQTYANVHSLIKFMF